MEKDNIDVKKVIPRLGGYYYEFQVGALRILDLLEGKADRIEIEAASDINDFFDDIKVFHQDKVHHYQVKWGLKQTPIGLGDFCNPSSDLYLPKLFKTWKLYSDQFPEYKHIFHVYTSKKIPDDDKLSDYLASPRNEEKIFSDNKEGSYKINTKILEVIKSDYDQPDLTDSSSIEDSTSFLKSLVIEIEQPAMPSSEVEEKQFGNQIKDLLLEKISYRLGLDKFPNLFRPIDLLALLIKESYTAAIRKLPLTRGYLSSEIGVKLNLNSISQDFPFDREHYIKTSKHLDELASKFNKASGKLIGVVGLPGTGKSHLLTFWRDALQDSGVKPIMYYCFVGHESHPDVRITRNQILQDLINNILRNYPDLSFKENHSLLAATTKRLRDLLSELGKYARSKDKTIPVIIDGLDHVIRTRQKYSEALSNQPDILDFLKELEIPEGVTLVIGSQPGTHLTDFQKRFGKDSFIEIKGFTTEESENYLAKFEISESTVSSEVIKSVIKRAGGLPLLLAYSVQANREISLDERKKNFKKISKELPKTNGDVKIYYDWLWESISSKTLTVHYARLLALVDFPAPKDLLENVISKSMRVGISLDECLSPLTTVIVETEEGMNFFHDSFGTYVSTDDTFSAEDKKWYYEKLYLYFNKVGLHSSDLAYVKGIDFAFKAQLYNEILNTVCLDFVDKSVMMAFPREQIISQIDFAIRSAVHTKNMPLLVKNCVLRKYTEDRFEFNYPLNEIARLFIKLKKDDQIKRLIFNNNALNTNLSETIDLLSLCLENGIELPYRRIMGKWRVRIKEDEENVNEELKSVDPKNYVKVITSLYGLEYALDWIRKNSGIHFDEKVFEIIGKFSSSDDIGKLIEKTEYEYREFIIILNSLLAAGNNERAKEILSTILAKKQFFTPYLIEIGISLGIKQDLIEKDCKVFVPMQPSIHPWDEEISELYQLEKSTKLLSYCGKIADLQTIIGTIKTYPLTSARLLQEMMFLLAVTEGKMDSKKSVTTESEKLLSELDRFVNHHTQYGIEPRDVDCTGLQYVAKYILKKLVKLYLNISDKPNLEKLVDLIKRLNHKFEWHGMGLTWILVSTEHMISCFSELMKQCSDNSYVRQKIMETIESTDDIPAATGERVDYFLQIARIYLAYDMKEKAETAFNNALFSTHAYGYRKDLFMDEVHEIAINLNMVDPSKSLDRAEDILKLTKYLWGVTDHAETKFIPANVTEELLRLRTKAGLKLLKQFNEEGYALASIECLPFAVSSMKNAPLSLRWALVSNTNYESEGASYDDENWLMGMKFELAKQAIEKNEKELARKIMENIREQISNEFKTCERKWENDFKSYAKFLKIRPLNLPSKSSKDSYLVGSERSPPNIIKDGSVKEIIDQFEKLDRKRYFDAEKDLEAIFVTKIKSMDEEEIDELIEFLSKRPMGIFNSTCGNLLEKCALRFKGKNDGKFVNVMFLAFDTYGWIGYGYPSVMSWLVETYNVDSKKTMNYVFESFARFSVEKYGPHGSIRRLSEFLYLTNQIDTLEKLYEELYEFCKTFFRTYTERFDEYRWLRGSKFETLEDEKIIQELIEIT